MDLSGLHVLEPGTPEEGVEESSTGFYIEYGYRPDVVGRAPGRVNLMGEHTDYNNGVTLPLALPHATYAAIAARDDNVVRITSSAVEGTWSGTLEGIGPGRVSGWAAYAAGVLWSMREEGIELPGVDIYVDSSVPWGAGLSSSAALEAAVAAGMWAIAGRDPQELDRSMLVDVCVRAESQIAGAPTGGMDQCAAFLTTPGEALYIDFKEFKCYDIDLQLEAAGAELLVVDSAVRHSLTHGSYGDRRRECERAAKALGVETLREADLAAVDALPDPLLRRRARHVVTEIARVEQVVTAFDNADARAVGELFTASHASLRDDFEISCTEVDVIVERLLSAGALGARLTGGGFGGSVVAILPSHRTGMACLAVEAAFRTTGWLPPRFLKLTPSEAAQVVFTA
ncbi:MAG: galactokinase [Nocardioides sp.]